MFKIISENKLFKTLYLIILFLIIIFLMGQIDYFMGPLMKIISLILFPIMTGGYLYYLFRPMVNFLTAKLKYKNLSIVITFLLIIGLIVGISYFGGNVIRNETEKLIKDFNKYYQPAKKNTTEMIQIEDGELSFLEGVNLQKKIVTFIENIVGSIQTNIVGFFSSLTNIGTKILLIPFVLFFLLKDDTKFYNQAIKLIPDENLAKTKKILAEIDKTLGKYIGGQVIVAIILGLLMFIGYLIIGLRRALILGLVAMITSFIPFIGPLLGILPAIFIGLTSGFWMVVKILIVLTVVQQLEGNVVRPIVQGDRLDIHPMLVIFLVLIFIILFGFLGALFAVPVYAVIRILFQGYFGSGEKKV